MGNLASKVAFITGAARGQGRSHAVRLAEDGADIIAVDLCAQVDSIQYPMSTKEDLDETVRQVEALGRRVVASVADVRDRHALDDAVAEGIRTLGRLDFVLANAGITGMSVTSQPEDWQDAIDVNLTGVYNTVEATVPTLVEQGEGGVIVLTGSTAALSGIGGYTPGGLGYTASKHGVVGLMEAYANYLAPHRIRVIAVHPTAAATPMVLNDVMEEYIRHNPQIAAQKSNALPVDLIEAIDISNAIAWLVSDAARYVTGISLPVDAGFTNNV